MNNEQEKGTRALLRARYRNVAFICSKGRDVLRGSDIIALESGGFEKIAASPAVAKLQLYSPRYFPFGASLHAPMTYVPSEHMVSRPLPLT